MEKLEEILDLSGSWSSETNQPIRVFYLPTIVETAEKIRDRKRALNELGKFHRAAMQHAYRGFSSGHKNGVVGIKETDLHLMEDYGTYVKKYSDFFSEKGIDIENLRPVKFVAHVQNGNRLVGALASTKSRYLDVYVFGVSNYSGKIA